jgi:LPXTG-motif cell wall-anchored protein
MRRAVSWWRKRATVLAVATAAVVAATVAGIVMVNAGPATATWRTLNGSVTCDCVVKNTKTNEYRAVFGYDNASKSTGKIERGENNRLEVTGADDKKVDGVQTTDFEPGSHKAAFATTWISKDAVVAWSVGGKRVSADWNKPTCGRDVSLPATGNGSGPLIALVASLLIAAGAIVLRRRRLPNRAA